jgi:glycosyltransferase involved in cell wall biosynthesis
MSTKLPSNTDKPIPRLAILQRVCPGYRTALFSKLSADEDWHVKLFIGESIPNSKVNNTPDLGGIRFEKLKTSFVKFGHRILPWHRNLVEELKKFDPDVILCEGESHFLGYLQAIWYKRFVNKKVRLIHWCFISLPGEPLVKPGMAGKIKGFTRKYFDAHLLYSSFSKDRLRDLGVSDKKIFVAANVGDVQKFLTMSDKLSMSATEARSRLKLPDKFTVLYTGTLDANKRPEMLLDLARVCDPEKFNFVLLGAGELLQSLRERADQEKLSNVFLPGRVSDELSMYFRASNAMIVPGRGGIVISEGMAFGLPVITHQADGTEYDLIRNDETGFILKHGDVADFRNVIELLQKNSDRCTAMGKAARTLLENNYTTKNMVDQIKRAATYAKATGSER